ncbi:unnamed protein product, partial [marine sediment metagenome]
ASFDYEGYYFTIGQNRGRISGEQVVRLDGPRKAGIARDGLEEVVNRPVELVDGIMAPADARAARIAEARRQELNQAGEFATTVVEPALESEINPIIPNSLAGKQQDLDQVRAEQEGIKNGQIPLNDPEGRLAELDERETALVEEIKDQKRHANEFATPEEKSALENTKEAAGIGAPPISTTSVPDPANQKKSDDLREAAIRTGTYSKNLDNIAAEQEELSQSAADQGNNELAIQTAESATENRAKAAEAWDKAQSLADASNAINPK